MFVRFFIGMLFVALGIVMLKYIRPTYELVGSWSWAEKFFGSGGTVVAIKLAALVFIVVGVIYALGMFEV